MNCILVIGASGRVGRQVATQLLAEDASVAPYLETLIAPACRLRLFAEISLCPTPLMMP
jgi:hypothetical protein